MMAKNIYLVPKGPIRDMRATVDLLEKFDVVKSGPAPNGMGLVCETAEAVSPEDREALGVLVWE